MLGGRAFWLAVSVGLATGAQATIISTFVAPNVPENQMFAIEGGQLVGGWNGSGLTLAINGMANPVPNARFSFAPLTLTANGFGYTTGPGTLRFEDGQGQLLFDIQFANANVDDEGFYASSLEDGPVTIAGPAISTQWLAPQFSFSWPSQFGRDTVFSASSPVPEPATLLALAAGSACLLRRRRR